MGLSRAKTFRGSAVNPSLTLGVHGHCPGQNGLAFASPPSGLETCFGNPFSRNISRKHAAGFAGSAGCSGSAEGAGWVGIPPEVTVENALAAEGVVRQRDV